MNYNFFASKDDKIEILEFVLIKMNLRIYDSHSFYEQEICEYKSVDEIISKFDLENGYEFSQTFQLWTPKHGGNPIFRKIALNPDYCNGHTFRYSTTGWGLIQLYFGGVEKHKLNQSHIGSFTEKGALSKETIPSINGQVKNWNWKEIESTFRKLKYQIHNKMAVRKIDSLGILKGADKLEKNGIIFG